MMKKILCIVFALLLCLLTACGSKKGGEGSGTTDSSGDQGGAGGSQSHLTPKGKLLLERYLEYEKQLKKQANELYEDYFGGIFV